MLVHFNASMSESQDKNIGQLNWLPPTPHPPPLICLDFQSWTLHTDHAKFAVSCCPVPFTHNLHFTAEGPGAEHQKKEQVTAFISISGSPPSQHQHRQRLLCLKQHENSTSRPPAKVSRFFRGETNLNEWCEVFHLLCLLRQQCEEI